MYDKGADRQGDYIAYHGHKANWKLKKNISRVLRPNDFSIGNLAQPRQNGGY